MLEYMHVKNLALIKDCEIQFGEGLNILTGETGAGKSVLLGSINMCLGAKADKDMIRTGADEAYVELMFSMNDAVAELLESMELTSMDDSVIISRKITQTKNVFKINGEIVPAKQVKELAGGLLDIHGQHEHQSLLSNTKQRNMLDAFGGEKIEKALSNVKSACEKYNKLNEALNDCLEHAESRERELSLLRYECNEISEANLINGEDEELEDAYKRMQSSEKLMGLVNEASGLISSGTGEDAGSLLSRAISDMRRAASLDESASGLEEILVNAESLLGDFSLEASKYMDKLEFSDEEFSRVEERLNVINTLKSKFGSSIEKILAYYDEKSAELDRLENLDTYLENLKRDTTVALAEYNEAANSLSRLRKEYAKEFEKLLSEELLCLNFNDASFEVDFDTDTDIISSQGFDRIEFMISVNPGEPVRPMKNVASGGELSRIMLAIKTLLAKKDQVDALIFDEIDAGISGRTAWEVSGRLSKLATEHQVIAITHLAQIAAAADCHFEIAKKVVDNTSITMIHRLNEEGEIMELARLLGSDTPDAATISNARELKQKALERKNTL